MRFFIILLSLSSILSSQAQDRGGDRHREPTEVLRIHQSKDPAARCMNTGISADYCERQRKLALESECITNKEYQALVRFGSTPSCDQYLAVVKVNSARKDKGLPPKEFSEFTRQEKLQQLMTWCPCGCFHPGSKISVVVDDHFDTKRAGTVARSPHKYELLHLRDDATKDYFTYSSSPIRISTKGKESKPLIHIYLEGNKKLRLTDNHPVLLPNMKMIFAKDVTVGMNLISKEGNPVKVLSIKKKMFKGEVVNFVVESQSDNPKEHIIFSDGIAVGDMYWQSRLDHNVDRLKMRLK